MMRFWNFFFDYHTFYDANLSEQKQLFASLEKYRSWFKCSSFFESVHEKTFEFIICICFYNMTFTRNQYIYLFTHFSTKIVLGSVSLLFCYSGFLFCYFDLTNFCPWHFRHQHHTTILPSVTEAEPPSWWQTKQCTIDGTFCVPANYSK